MKIREIETKSILSKTGIPIADYVINLYIGCIHSCVFCYARFMKRFTGHQEDWGKFLDIKINAPDLIPENTSKYEGKYIFLSFKNWKFLMPEMFTSDGFSNRSIFAFRAKIQINAQNNRKINPIKSFFRHSN